MNKNDIVQMREISLRTEKEKPLGSENWKGHIGKILI